MNVQEVVAPGERVWHVRIYRWRLPPWRTVTPDFEGDVIWMLFPIVVPLYVLMTVLGLTLLPLLTFVIETSATAAWALVSDQRRVEALAGETGNRMTWVTSGKLAPAVAEQVARQLALGYDRVQPHNAVFLGFG